MIRKYVFTYILLFTSIYANAEECFVTGTGGFCVSDDQYDAIIATTAPALRDWYAGSYLDQSTYNVNYGVTYSQGGDTFPDNPEDLEAAKQAFIAANKGKCVLAKVENSQCIEKALRKFNEQIVGCGTFNFTANNGVADLYIFQVLDTGTFYQVCQNQFSAQRDLAVQSCEVDYQETKVFCEAIGVQ